MGSDENKENISSPDQLKKNSNTDSNINPSQGWLKCGEYTLTLFDKSVLESPKDWLTDTIINAAQYLLKEEFPEIKGLQNVLLNSFEEFETIDEKDFFVQIINDEGNHWIVVSNAKVDDTSHKCVIYDSRAKVEKTYSKDVIKAILTLMKANTITVEVADVSQQPDQHQCGLYAVAFAHLLCSGGDPSELLLSNSPRHLRNHLLECLTKGQITRFPTGSETIIDTFVL